MALKKLRLNIISGFLLCILPISLFSQKIQLNVDSLSKQVFNADLSIVKSSMPFKSKRPVILISVTPCSACVKYFSATQKHYRFIFIINNKSLLEVNRILAFYHVNRKNVFFITVDDLLFNKKYIITGPTPIAFVKSKSNVKYVDYSELNQITKEFTAPHNLVSKQLEK